MADLMTQIEQTVSQWEGIVAHPHRFGGTEFMWGKVEIGHLHRGGLVDIPFTTRIKEQLILEGKAFDHHILADSGWISYWVKTEKDVQHAIWLFRLSYLHKISARSRRSSISGNFELDMNQELRYLELSAALRRVVVPSKRNSAD